MDELQDRIAVVISNHRMTGTNYEIARAVIAELGLREETRRRSFGLGMAGVTERAQHRYVTDWTASD